MQADVVTFGRNDRLSDVNELMKDRNVRHVVVLDEDDRVCGVVSQRELYRGALMRALGYGSHLTDKMLNEYVVKEAMSSELHVTSKDTRASEAAGLMLKKKIGCLPVLDDKKLIGIVTESDFLKLVADGINC